MASATDDRALRLDQNTCKRSHVAYEPRHVRCASADPNASGNIDPPSITHAHEITRRDRTPSCFVMLTISALHFRPCERLRACCHEKGLFFRGRRAQLRTSTVYVRSIEADVPMRATRNTLEDGTIQYLFLDVSEDEAVVTDVSEGDSSDGELSDTDDGTETEDDIIDDDKRDDVLYTLTVKKLKKICKDHGVKGYSALRKRDLVKLIRDEIQTLDI